MSEYTGEYEAAIGAVAASDSFTLYDLSLKAHKKATIAQVQAAPQGSTGTATATAGAATLATLSGKVTSEALTTAQDATYTLTITNTSIAAADIVLVSVKNGTNTQGTTVVTKVTPAAGSVVIIIHNKHASAEAFNGTLVISYVVFKTA